LQEADKIHQVLLLHIIGWWGFYPVWKLGRL